MSQPEVPALEHERHFNVRRSLLASGAATALATTVGYAAFGGMPHMHTEPSETVRTTAEATHVTPWTLQPPQSTATVVLREFVPGSYARRYDQDPAAAQPADAQRWNTVLGAIRSHVDAAGSREVRITFTGEASAEAGTAGPRAGIDRADVPNHATALRRATAAAASARAATAGADVETRAYEHTLPAADQSRMEALRQQYGFVDIRAMLADNAKAAQQHPALRAELATLLGRRGVTVHVTYTETTPGTCVRERVTVSLEETQEAGGHILLPLFPLPIPLWTRRRPKTIPEPAAQTELPAPRDVSAVLLIGAAACGVAAGWLLAATELPGDRCKRTGELTIASDCSPKDTAVESPLKPWDPTCQDAAVAVEHRRVIVYRDNKKITDTLIGEQPVTAGYS